MQDNNDIANKSIEHMQDWLPTCQDQRPNVNGHDWCVDYQPVKTSAPM